jgi:alanine racemase
MPTLQRATMRFRPTVAVIDLDAIRHNVRTLQPERAQLMAVVKANGYGHGAIRVAEAAVEAGAAWLGVALVEEGIALRDAGLSAPILVLTEFPPGSEREALGAGLTPTLYTLGGIERLATAARGAPVGVHIKLDTGMHRVGLPAGEAVSFLRSVDSAGLRIEGLWTHLAKSEELADPFTSVQIDRFDRAALAARRAGFRPSLHAANSAAAMARPQTHYDLVRLGLAVYGLCPGPDLMESVAQLRPAMSWRSAVTLVKRVVAGERVSYGQRYLVERESSIATVPVGYADGYSRLLSNKAHVLIRGRAYPVAGTVTMDQLMVDCGDDPVEAGDEVVLIGHQGDAAVTADDLASWMGTISYEVVCGVSERVPREYVGAK